MLELGGVFPWFGRFMCVLALLPIWYCGMELIPLSSVLLLLSACNMARGQEEASTSQVGRRRGPGRDTPSASSIISSLSMEELKSYCQIPDNIDFELSDGPTASTIDEKRQRNIFYPGIAHSRALLPHFISGQAVPTLLWRVAYSYPPECHSEPD